MTPATSSHAARYLAVALIALLIATVLVLALALASSQSASDQPSSSIRVVPSAPSSPLPPSAAERNHPEDVNGPGMRP